MNIIMKIGAMNVMQQEATTTRDVRMRGTEGNYRYSSGSGNGMSTFGAILCVIGGFVRVALLLTILNIEVDDVPAFVLVILIIVITSVIGGVVSAIKGK